MGELKTHSYQLYPSAHSAGQKQQTAARGDSITGVLVFLTFFLVSQQSATEDDDAVV